MALDTGVVLHNSADRASQGVSNLGRCSVTGARSDTPSASRLGSTTDAASGRGRAPGRAPAVTGDLCMPAPSPAVGDRSAHVKPSRRIADAPLI
ncbi:MAG: hypothetical protein QOH57_1613 [Mycobacterium sp.]|jgi:hypothetical protein|nr:hypothetical protein [Mycobacterium sp.]